MTAMVAVVAIGKQGSPSEASPDSQSVRLPKVAPGKGNFWKSWCHLNSNISRSRGLRRDLNTIFYFNFTNYPYFIVYSTSVCRRYVPAFMAICRGVQIIIWCLITLKFLNELYPYMYISWVATPMLITWLAALKSWWVASSMSCRSTFNPYITSKENYCFAGSLVSRISSSLLLKINLQNTWTNFSFIKHGLWY
jgi:hypothetical protein